MGFSPEKIGVAGLEKVLPLAEVVYIPFLQQGRLCHTLCLNNIYFSGGVEAQKMKKLSSGYEQKRARVEMLPLIDAVFLLLVFFIYAMLSMVVPHGLRLELPRAESADREPSDFITISIDAQSRFFLEGEPADKEKLVREVVALRGAQKRPVLIEADRKAALGPAVELLDGLKKAGVDEVAFSCEKE
jgi:biopolymer transport protein ExbD